MSRPSQYESTKCTLRSPRHVSSLFLNTLNRGGHRALQQHFYHKVNTKYTKEGTLSFPVPTFQKNKEKLQEKNVTCAFRGQ